MDSDALRWIHEIADGKMLPTDGEGLNRLLVAFAKVLVMRREQQDEIIRRLWALERRD